MRAWGKRLIPTLVLTLCAFHCDNNNGYTTSYYIQNQADITVVISIQPSHYNPKVVLKTGESVQIARENACVSFCDISFVDYVKLTLFTEDGDLLRYWASDDKPGDIDSALEGCHASYFKDYGVRQLHDVKEWTIRKEEKDYEKEQYYREYVFSILPEDLVPLDDIVGL